MHMHMRMHTRIHAHMRGRLTLTLTLTPTPTPTLTLTLNLILTPTPPPNPNSTPIMSRCAPNHENGLLVALLGNFMPDNGPNSLLYFTEKGETVRCVLLSKMCLVGLP